MGRVHKAPLLMMEQIRSVNECRQNGVEEMR